MAREADEVAGAHELHHLVVEQLAARIVGRRSVVRERVREVAGGEEQRVPPQLLGAAPHELAEGTVLAVGAHDGERDDAAHAQEAQRHEHAPVEHVGVVRHHAQLLGVAGERQEQLGEREVVVVAEGGVRTAEPSEVAVQPGSRAHDVGVAEAVAVR